MIQRFRLISRAIRANTGNSAAADGVPRYDLEPTKKSDLLVITNSQIDVGFSKFVWVEYFLR